MTDVTVFYLQGTDVHQKRYRNAEASILENNTLQVLRTDQGVYYNPNSWLRFEVTM
jgi:hypothetical protein